MKSFQELIHNISCHEQILKFMSDLISWSQYNLFGTVLSHSTVCSTELTWFGASRSSAIGVGCTVLTGNRLIASEEEAGWTVYSDLTVVGGGEGSCCHHSVPCFI